MAALWRGSRALVCETEAQESLTLGESPLIASKRWMRREAGSRGRVGSDPSAPEVEAGSARVLVEDPEKDVAVPFGPQMLQKLRMCEAGKPTAPGRDGRTKVQEFIPSRRSESSHSSGVVDDEAVNTRISDLTLPPVTNLVLRKGMCLLREDMAEARDRAFSLHCNQGLKVCQGEWLEDGHS